MSDKGSVPVGDDNPTLFKTQEQILIEALQAKVADLERRVSELEGSGDVITFNTSLDVETIQRLMKEYLEGLGR